MVFLSVEKEEEDEKFCKFRIQSQCWNVTDLSQLLTIQSQPNFKYSLNKINL